jgi:hypothetical protein
VCIAERAPELSLDTNPPRDINKTISMHQNPWNMEAMCNQELALAIFTLSHMFTPRLLHIASHIFNPLRAHYLSS